MKHLACVLVVGIVLPAAKRETTSNLLKSSLPCATLRDDTDNGFLNKTTRGCPYGHEDPPHPGEMSENVTHRIRKFDMKPRASVFIGASVDGFIARLNHDLDFLPPGGGEEHGYEEFIKSVDALVVGRNTYDKVLGFNPWPYGKKPVVVLSTRPFDPPTTKEAVVERLSGTPSEILDNLASRGWTHVYVDGGITITRFLEANLIQRLVITRVPVLIGTGIPLFGAFPRDIKLTHIVTRSYQSGLVQSEYRVAGSEAEQLPGPVSRERQTPR